ncbi:MAG: dual specificity protein phosphatase family protein [Planctomycetota bacterium]
MTHRRFSKPYARLVFYPTLVWNVLLGRILPVRRWWDFIDPNVIVGAFPFARDVPAMVDDGVAAVVNTCEEYAGPTSAYADANIEQLWIPTTDFTHPRLADVEKAVEFVQHHVAQGRTVYIHCKAGRARSATIAMAWLMKYRDMTPEQAQRHLLECRSHINPKVCQRPVILEFAKRIHELPR